MNTLQMPKLQEHLHQAQQEMNSTDSSSPEKLYAKYITHGRKTSILICEPESHTRSSQNIECGDTHVHINVIRNTNRFQVIERDKKEENRSDGPGNCFFICFCFLFFSFRVKQPF